MGAVQACCFDDAKRRNGEHRVTKRKNNNSGNSLKNNINKKKPLKQKEDNKNNSDCHLTEIKNKETPKKNNNNKTIRENTYTSNKVKKKKKNKSSSVEVPKQFMRKNTYDGKDETPNLTKNENKNPKIVYVKMKEKPIGEGRYGKVYSGYIISNGRFIAIKTYNNLTDIQKNRIIKNLDKLYSLNHENIIKAISLPNRDVYDENGDFHIVFECISQGNVGKLIDEYGSLNEVLIQKYTKQLLEGLQYLHKNKIYHKNLKSNNFLVNTDGTIKISDCLVDSLILGNAKEIYLNLLKSEKIDYYIPPFFIQSINEYKKNKNIDNFSENYDEDDDNIFNDWQSYDLWFLGCLIIEVASKKKPWSNYNFKNNQDFLEFLGSTHLIPTIPEKLDKKCQELIEILLNYNMTKQNNIYDIILGLDFFKMSPNDFTSNNINNNINNKINGINNNKNNLNESLNQLLPNEDSNTSINNNINSESGTQLGQILAKNKVVNILNSDNNASFSLSYTVEDNISMTQSSYMNNRISRSGTLNQSNMSRGRNININNININIISREMAAVPEAQIEYSPDPVKDSNENKKRFNY